MATSLSAMLVVDAGTVAVPAGSWPTDKAVDFGNNATEYATHKSTLDTIKADYDKFKV